MEKYSTLRDGQDSHFGTDRAIVYVICSEQQPFGPTILSRYNVSVPSLVYLTDHAPPPMASDLTLAGYTVWEAPAVSEVLYLCEHENVDVVVIGPDVEDADVIEVQMRRITLRLKPGATAKDVMWELAQLFPFAVTASVQ